jgi:hypothetical protein
MVDPTVTIPVLFQSTPDATGHYKKITVTLTDDTIGQLELKADAVVNELHGIDGRTWSWSLPYTVV